MTGTITPVPDLGARGALPVGTGAAAGPGVALPQLDAPVGFARSQGSFQLNVFKTVTTWCVLESIQSLGDACRMFDLHRASGIEANLDKTHPSA